MKIKIEDEMETTIKVNTSQMDLLIEKLKDSIIGELKDYIDQQISQSRRLFDPTEDVGPEEDIGPLVDHTNIPYDPNLPYHQFVRYPNRIWSDTRTSTTTATYNNDDVGPDGPNTDEVRSNYHDSIDRAFDDGGRITLTIDNSDGTTTVSQMSTDVAGGPEVTISPELKDN